VKAKKSRKQPALIKKSSSKIKKQPSPQKKEKAKKIKEIEKALKKAKPRKKRATKEVIVEQQQAPAAQSIEKAAEVAVPKNQYFTKTHEAAILKYATSTDRHEKSVLYVTLIQPAFNEMVDKIVFTYKFTSLPNIEDLKDECKIWLTTILDKFDVSKGSKAFSYFSVITKNWFIHKVKKNSSGKEVGLEDISQEFEEDNLFVTNGYEEEREKDEFWQALWQEMDYLYIREMTGLSTKQIVSSLNKFKVVYARFLKGWNTGEYRQVNRHGEQEKYGETS